MTFLFLFHFIQNGPGHDSDEEFELSLAQKDAEIAWLNRALAAKEQEQTNAAQQDWLDDRFGAYYLPGWMYPWHPWMPYPLISFHPPLNKTHLLKPLSLSWVLLTSLLIPPGPTFTWTLCSEIEILVLVYPLY